MKKILLIILWLLLVGVVFAGTIDNEYVKFTYPDMWKVSSDKFINDMNEESEIDTSSSMNATYKIKTENSKGEETEYTEKDERVNGYI